MTKHYKRLSIKAFLLVLPIIVFSLQAAVYAKEPQLFVDAKKITLFKSTRQDVERIFKFEGFKEILEYNYPGWFYSPEQIEEAKKNPENYYSVYYDVKGATLHVNYSKGKCSGNTALDGYDLEKDVVTWVYLDFHEPVKISQLKLDLSKFTKTEFNSDLIGEGSYTSRDLGIYLDVVSKWVGGVIFAPLSFEVEKYRCDRYPTDAEMEATFNEKRAVFEKLAQMSDEDPEAQIITYSASPVSEAADALRRGVRKQVNFSSARWDRYKRLFREINLKHGLLRADGQSPKGILFRRDSKFYAFASADKGYIYTKETPAPLVESIDAITEPLKSGDGKAREFFEKEHRFYKKISDNWYIYFDYEFN